MQEGWRNTAVVVVLESFDAISYIIRQRCQYVKRIEKIWTKLVRGHKFSHKEQSSRYHLLNGRRYSELCGYWNGMLDTIFILEGVIVDFAVNPGNELLDITFCIDGVIANFAAGPLTPLSG